MCNLDIGAFNYGRRLEKRTREKREEGKRTDRRRRQGSETKQKIKCLLKLMDDIPGSTATEAKKAITARYSIF